MRTLALVLAAVLGTGCIVTDDDPEVGLVNLYWEFIRNAPAQQAGFIVYDGDPWTGTVTGACPQSGVDAVRIDSGVGRIDVNCQEFNPQDGVSVQGVSIGGLREGPQTIRVTGYRGDLVVYTSTVQVNVIANSAVEAFASVEPVSAEIDLFADFSDVTSGGAELPLADCATAGLPNVAFVVADVFGTVIVDGEVGCSDPLPAIVALETLDLDDYVVRMQGIETIGPNAGLLTFDSCSVDLAHFGPQTGIDGFVAVLLAGPGAPVCAN